MENMLAGCFDYIYTLLLFFLAFAARCCFLEEVLADCARRLLVEFQLVSAKLEWNADVF